jgi:hypothetical protein
VTKYNFKGGKIYFEPRFQRFPLWSLGPIACGLGVRKPFMVEDCGEGKPVHLESKETEE